MFWYSIAYPTALTLRERLHFVSDKTNMPSDYLHWNSEKKDRPNMAAIPRTFVESNGSATALHPQRPTTPSN